MSPESRVTSLSLPGMGCRAVWETLQPQAGGIVSRKSNVEKSRVEGPRRTIPAEMPDSRPLTFDLRPRARSLKNHESHEWEVNERAVLADEETECIHLAAGLAPRFDPARCTVRDDPREFMSERGGARDRNVGQGRPLNGSSWSTTIGRASGLDQI